MLSKTPPIAVAVRLVAVAAILFGDIGFVHPGRFGLAFEHLLLLAGIYVVALLTGINASAKARRVGMIALQVALLIALVVGFTAAMLRADEPVAPAATEMGR